MASAHSPGSVRPSSPTEIRRTRSSQQGQQGLSVSFSRYSSSSSSPKRQSKQERIDDILEGARHRAGSMTLQGHYSLRASIMPSSLSGDVEDPDERTSIVIGRNPMNYQSTETTSNLRNRQSPSQTETSTVDQNRTTAHNTEEKRGLLDYLGGVWSIELENKGSVARDHLALERTFLAWLRTSLAFASIGIAITQLFRLNSSISDKQSSNHFRHLGRPLGTTFIGISILVLFLGYHRFYQPQQWLLKGKFPASRGTIILVSFLAFALMLTSLVVILVIPPASVQMN